MNTKYIPKQSSWFWKSWLVGSLFFWGFLVGSARADSSEAATPRIRAVVFERQDVFSKDQERFWLFRLANKLHMRTKEPVVRRELLIKEGDAYDSILAAETERNLRGLRVFGSVSVTPHIVSDSLVDVLVETTDQWTTEGSFSFGGGGGAYQFSLGLEEKNLLGRGQKLELVYEETDLLVGRRGSFYDRRVLSLPFSLALVGESRSDGDYYQIEAGRPLYSSMDKWGGNLRLFSFSEPKRFFVDRKERFFFRQKTKEAGFSVLRSWGKTFKTALSLSYVIAQNNFEGPIYSDPADTVYKPGQFGFIEPEKRVHAVSTALIWYANRYWEERYLDNFGMAEDIRNGETVSLEYVLAPELLGSSLTRHEAAFSVGTIRRAGAHLYRLSFGNRTSFLSNRWEGTFWQGGIRYYWRWGARQTAAIRLDLSSIGGVSRYGQFLLGGENGLRGYDARSFAGSRMVLGTVEQRVFGSNLFSLLGLGGVLFVDFGDAWIAGEDFRWDSFKSSWGVGLRFGLLRSSQFKVLRLDCARPFGPGGWVVSFGTGMSFNLE